MVKITGIEWEEGLYEIKFSDVTNLLRQLLIQDALEQMFALGLESIRIHADHSNLELSFEGRNEALDKLHTYFTKK